MGDGDGWDVVAWSEAKEGGRQVLDVCRGFHPLLSTHYLRRDQFVHRKFENGHARGPGCLWPLRRMRSRNRQILLPVPGTLDHVFPRTPHDSEDARRRWSSRGSSWVVYQQVHG